MKEEPLSIFENIVAKRGKLLIVGNFHFCHVSKSQLLQKHSNICILERVNYSIGITNATQTFLRFSYGRYFTSSCQPCLIPTMSLMNGFLKILKIMLKNKLVWMKVSIDINDRFYFLYCFVISLKGFYFSQYILINY